MYVLFVVKHNYCQFVIYNATNSKGVTSNPLDILQQLPRWHSGTIPWLHWVEIECIVLGKYTADRLEDFEQLYPELFI